MSILFSHGEDHTADAAKGKALADTTESKTLCMCRSFRRENRETLWAHDERAWRDTRELGRLENVKDGTAGMNAHRESDGFILPTKSMNKGATESSAESVEGRGPAKKNAEQEASRRTPGRNKRESRGLVGVREAARKDSKLVFNCLLHHINKASLREAFTSLKKRAASGVDGVRWSDYEQNMEANLANLHERIHRGAYRAMPSRRCWISKTDGRQRPLGIAALEDKIVQRAALEVLG